METRHLHRKKNEKNGKKIALCNRFLRENVGNGETHAWGVAPCGFGWLVGVVTLDYKTRLLVYVPPPSSLRISLFRNFINIFLLCFKNVFYPERGGSADDHGWRS